MAWEPVCAPASCFGCKQTRGQSVQGQRGAREKETADWDAQSASVKQQSAAWHPDRLNMYGFTDSVMCPAALDERHNVHEMRFCHAMLCQQDFI